MKFEWVSSPPAETVLRALENLAAAGMVGEDGRLTVTGEKVSEFPIEVNVARMVRATLRSSARCAKSLHTVICFEGLQLWRRDAYNRGDDHNTGSVIHTAVMFNL